MNENNEKKTAQILVSIDEKVSKLELNANGIIDDLTIEQSLKLIPGIIKEIDELLEIKNFVERIREGKLPS